MPNRRKLWVPLRIKFALLFGTAMLGFSLFVYYYYSNILEKQYVSAANDKASTIAKIFSSSLAPALEFGDIKSIQEAISALMRGKSIEFCVVTQRDGTVVSSFNPALAEKIGYSKLSGLDSSFIVNDVIAVRHPVTYNNEEFGKVFLGISLKEFIAQTEQMRRNVAIITLLLFVGGMIVVVSFSELATRSVRAVAAAAERIAGGDLTQRVDVRSSDETGELAVAFNDMAEKLQELLSREREVMAIRGRFLNTISHEFRTPLTGILISTELLEAYGHKMNAVQIGSEIGKIKLRVNDLRTLMDDFMLHTSATSLREMFTPLDIDLTKIVTQCLEQQLPVAAVAEIQVIKDFTNVPRLINGDAKLLQYVFANLISNAVKYSQKGGKIVVSILQSGQRCTVLIADTGIGIPAADSDKIFRPFFRAANTSQVPGAGLGLSIAKEFTELHNGDISFTSTPEGTTFVVGLPLAGSWSAEDTVPRSYK